MESISKCKDKLRILEFVRSIEMLDNIIANALGGVLGTILLGLISELVWKPFKNMPIPTRKKMLAYVLSAFIVLLPLIAL